jgi:OPA family glycerol-3-phosphate transporter-like MFS transporter 1/2
MRLPFGALAVDQIRSGFEISKRKFYQSSILIVTFFVYFVYHLTRRPFSIVKSKLHHENCTDYVIEQSHEGRVIVPPNNYTNATNWCDWSPFDTKDANYLLGLLDTCYLVTYAVFMFMAGYVAERSNLRYFLTISLIICGILCFLFGITYTFQIHVLYYFIIIQILTGIAQTTGWPAVVSAVGNWFGSAKKGLIFGIWNSHTSFGNIAGAAIAGIFIKT